METSIDYPRVEDLSYRVEMGAGHELASNASLEGTLPSFRFTVVRDSATFYPLRRFVTEEEARAVLDPQLKAWELDCALRFRRRALTFTFVSSFVQSEPPRAGVIYARPGVLRIIAMPPILKAVHARHPSPPVDFAIDDCVEDVAALFLQSCANPGGLLKA